MTLVNNWKKFWKYYSNIFHTIQLSTIFAWNNLPPEWKASVPTKVLLLLSSVVWGMGVLGSVINQKDNIDGQ